MVEKALKFWDMVQNDTPPVMVAEDGGVIAEIYPKSTEELIEMNEINDRVAYMKELEMHQKEIGKEIDEIKTEFKSIIQDKLGIKTPQYIVTWKTIQNTKLDTDRLWEELPDINKYTKTTEYRVMRVVKNKEAKNGTTAN